ncbi:TPA: hypothetical protein DHU97_01375 [Candidatus Saccharibacteria bacterium]|nr:hypothetical protein [Candidatus Saccharibacteria bacterium]
MGNHICSIDLTSSNISFTTLSILDKVDSLYLPTRGVSGIYGLLVLVYFLFICAPLVCQ